MSRAGPDDEQPSARGETPLQQLDRHWVELLQELRVVQTGVQVLTGFLLTLPFQQRFAGAAGWQVSLYLVTVAAAVLATALFAAPVAVHRAVFRRHARGALVQAGHRCAVLGLAALAVALTGVVVLVVSVLVGAVGGVVAGALAAAVFAVLWLALPLAMRRRAPAAAARERIAG